MKTLIVVNGERNWQEYFAGYEVHYRRLQNSKWFYFDNKLWSSDSSGTIRVDAVLWRLGAVRPHPNHHAVLELIRLAQIPCLNPPSTLLRGYDRLSMLNEMREAGLPLIPFSAVVGEEALDKLAPVLPSVVKIGNHHAGFGKAKISENQQWQDIKDLSFVTEDYITVEPYIDYVADIRCLAIGEQIWAMSRRGSGWKANTDTIHYELISVPSLLAEHTMTAMKHLGADMLGLDFLQNEQGQYLLLESNDIPGLAGFPDEVFTAVARRMREKIE
jgi:ribosomal protein S6--L-glutamate ligase